MASQNDTHTWPELAIGLYDQLTDRNAEIAYSFDNMEVSIPSGTSNETDNARWRLNGTVRVTTKSGVQA